MNRVDRLGGRASRPSSSGRSSSSRVRPWTTALAVLALTLLAANALLFETLASMVEVWDSNATYNYCFLIPAISAYVAWQRRHEILTLTPAPSWLGLLLVFGFACLWLVADAASLNEGRHAALIGVNQSLILAILGGRVVRRLLFPVLYLWLGLPTGLFLLGPLQSLAADMSVGLLRLTGIPVFQQGTLIEIPTGRYVVAEVCAGLNFLLASLALSLVYSNLLYEGLVKRAATVAIALAVALVANWFRIWGIIVFNHMTGGGIDIAGNHLIWGWGFFAAVSLLTMWVGFGFRDEETPPIIHRDRGPMRAIGPLRHGATGAMAILLLALPLAYGAYTLTPAQAASDLRVGPRVPATWSEVPADPYWNPIFVGADRIERTAFNAGQGAVDLFIAHYRYEGEGRKLVAFQNRLYDIRTWRLEARGAGLADLNGKSRPVLITRLNSDRGQREIWHWYLVDGRVVTSWPLVKLLQAKARLFGGVRHAAVIAISAAQQDAAGGGGRALEAFVSESRFQPEAWFDR